MVGNRECVGEGACPLWINAPIAFDETIASIALIALTRFRPCLEL